MVSILILTYNEEINLPKCLKSVEWCDDIVVLDSFSTDKTAGLAVEFGARVVSRKFDDWSSHQNWAMENIQFKHKWVFYLDADELMSPELKAELFVVASDANEERVAFYCWRKNYFMGKWIRHAYPPTYIMRFFIPAKVRFCRLVNPQPIIDGAYGYLKSYFPHYNFSKGMSDWFDKHNKYSQWEAIEGGKHLGGSQTQKASVFSGDRAERRIALKALSFHMPFRPGLKFFYLYIIKMGILDGGPGLTYCLLQAIYEYMIAIKMKELKMKEEGLAF